MGTIYSGSTGVGIHLLWITVLASIIAGSTAWAFAKCSNIYPRKNGGGFYYTLRTIGPFHGWMVGFYQYILIPVKATAVVFIAITVTFEGLYDPLMWGENTKLYLNLFSLLIYLAISVMVLFGTRAFKWTANLISNIKLNWFIDFNCLWCDYYG